MNCALATPALQPAPASATDATTARKALVQILQSGIVPVAVQPIEGPGFGPGHQWVELLARPRVGGQAVSPAALASYADGAGFGREFDLAVFDMAARYLAITPQVVRCGVNLTGTTLCASEDVEHQILTVLETHGVQPERICVEVSEMSRLTDVARARQVLRGLKAAGMKVALDDFGGGHSHLRLGLYGLVDVIKLDKHLLWDAMASVSDDGLQMGRAVKALADTLDAVLVIEGVQGPAEEAALIAALPGVYKQGYEVGRPTLIAQESGR